jgi:hypothetical protein
MITQKAIDRVRHELSKPGSWKEKKTLKFVGLSATMEVAKWGATKTTQVMNGVTKVYYSIGGSGKEYLDESEFIRALVEFHHGNMKSLNDLVEPRKGD